MDNETERDSDTLSDKDTDALTLSEGERDSEALGDRDVLADGVRLGD